MPNWIANAVDYDPASLKDAVDLAAVVQALGVELVPESDRRWVGLCPFHEDSSASFAVWRWEENDAWACGCWACSPFRNQTRSTGDLFDFLQAREGLTFPQAIERALSLRDSDLSPVAAGAAPAGPMPDLGRMLEKATEKRTGLLAQLLTDRGVPVPVEWVYDSWRVGDSGGEVRIPHFDLEGKLIALKHRAPDQGWQGRSVRGSRLEALYGSWRARGGASRPIVLCEGESDTWTVSWLLRGEPVDVLGLPSGATATPKDEWLDLVAGRPLTLLLDADRAGREGAGRWAASAAGRASEIRIAALPDGLDASSAGAETVRKALDEAWPLVDPSHLPVYVSDGRYMRRTAKDETPDTVLSDFTLLAGRLVEMQSGGIVFECTVPGRQGVQHLTDLELSSAPKLRRWAAGRMLSWKGGERDVTDLLELLKAQSILVPRVRGTDVIGLHGNVFVLPGDDTIGASGWGYVPPENDISLGESIDLGGSGWDTIVPNLLAKLHRPEVITPILGWIAAAPLRSIVHKFPVLGVTGGSGFGKALALDTPIPTPTGWTTMGDVKVGDVVFGSDGKPKTVMITSPVMLDKVCYRVEFSDSSSIVASGDHLWATRTNQPRPNNRTFGAGVYTTIQISESLRSGSDQRLNHRISVAGAMDLPEEDLVVDPYLFGLWLGDGCTHDGAIFIADPDVPVMKSILDEFSYEQRWTQQVGCMRVGLLGLKVQLRELGVLAEISQLALGVKHIPAEYLRASIPQRLALLQGLMDSDGNILQGWSECRFTNTNERLVNQVLELVRSLGLRPNLRVSRSVHRGVDKGELFTVSFSPSGQSVFRLPRKLARIRGARSRDNFRTIMAVMPVPSVPVKCLGVDSDDHLFLAGEGMIPTHNTTIIETILSTFGFWTSSPTTLTGTTPHGIQSYAGSTNSIPIWFDEYRPGARHDAKMALDQIIRDAWDGSSTIKGGMSENRMKIAKLPARAPLLVTGEDEFSETSHSERMVMIPMPKDGKDATVLQRIQGAQTGGMGRAYLEWLLTNLNDDTIPAPPDIPDRKAQARAVAEWGYELLDQFCHEVCGYGLPTYDDSLAAAAHESIEQTPVIVEAIIEALGRHDQNGQAIAFAEGDDVFVKPQALTTWWSAQKGAVQLPGGSRAVGTWLKQVYGAHEVKHNLHNRMLFVPGLLKGRQIGEES